MARPVIALLTDFGLRDHYVGTMKGVALGICPDATLVDLTHDIPAQDCLAGALELEAAYRYLPHGTVFLVVVDPGVGSARRPIAVDTGDYRFVGPDNGVLDPAFRRSGWRAVELTEGRYWRPEISRTFEGRDRFAPVAAWLAQGTSIADLGPEIANPARLEWPAPREQGDVVIGLIVRVDRFGNLVTNIPAERVREEQPGGIEVGRSTIHRVVDTYADVPHGQLCALVGSSGWLEIAVNGGSAANALRLGRYAEVRLFWPRDTMPRL
jgi:S-adenosyl-L-methionine hydrolase (adenosine-forming)